MISIIAALGKNNVIGKDNSLPWKLPADMKHFIEITKGKTVIMGRKTFESIGKPLKDRTNIILTRSNYEAEGCIVVHSAGEAMKVAEGDAMIIGGASVYAQFLPATQMMYLTLIDHAFDGDVHFPEFEKDKWDIVEYEEHPADDQNPYNYAFVTLKRKASGAVMQ